MTILLAILVPLAIVGFLFRDKLKAFVATSSATAPQPVRLFSYNRFPLASQIQPGNTYVPERGRAPQTLAECRAAGWYLTQLDAVSNGPAPIVPPPFGEAPTVPTNPLTMFSTTVRVTDAGDFVAGSWTPVVAV